MADLSLFFGLSVFYSFPQTRPASFSSFFHMTARLWEVGDYQENLVL
jgi:hypothetical protein